MSTPALRPWIELVKLHPVCAQDSEVLYVLQRRLLGGRPEENTAQEVAEAYSKVITGMRQAYAETLSDRQFAEKEGLALQKRSREMDAHP